MAVINAPPAQDQLLRRRLEDKAGQPMVQGLPVNLDGPKERDPGGIIPPTPQLTAPKRI